MSLPPNAAKKLSTLLWDGADVEVGSSEELAVVAAEELILANSLSSSDTPPFEYACDG
jgi:hypothetical protein